MPATVIAALASAGAAAVGGFGVAALSALAGGLASYAVSAAFGGARSKRPNASVSLESRTLSIRQPIAPREIVYGEVRKGGVIVFAGNAAGGDQQSTIENFVVPPAPHQVRVANAAQFLAVESVTLADERSDGLGGSTVTFTDLALSAGTPSGNTYARSGGLFTFPEQLAGRSVRIVYSYSRALVSNARLRIVYAMASHEIDAYTGFFFDDEQLVVDSLGRVGGRFAGHASVVGFLGTADQAASADLVANVPGWSANHRLRGIAYCVVALQWNPDLFPNGIPNFTASLRGAKLYDPRTGLTAWSNNWALAVAHYLADARYGLGASYASQQDTAQLIAAANVCDELVPLAAGGSERRYTCNGVISTGAKRRENLEALLSAGAGRAVKVGPTWRVLPAAYMTPSVTLTESDLRGPVRIVPRLSRRELANGVKGVFVSPANAWQAADFPAVASSAFLAEDGGQRLWRDIDLPFTTSAATAQRIAKIELLRTRQQITVTLDCKLSAYRVRAGDVVLLTLARYGWSAKPFEVVEATLSIGADATGVRLLLRETAPAVYDWQTSEEQQLDPAPDTALPNPLVVLSPGAPAIAEELYETTGSAGVRARARVTWAASPDGQALGYELEWQEVGATGWRQSGALVGREYVIDDIAPGRYDVRVRARNALGVASLWSQSRVELLGLSGRPADVTGLTVQIIGSLALLYWSRHPDLDVRIGGRLHIRHSELLTGASWENSYSVIDPIPGDATSAAVPAKSGTYLVRAEDSSGTLAAAAASVVTRAGTVLAFAGVGAPVQEDPTFPGAKSGVVVSGSSLTLSGSGLWDSIADVDAVSNVDGFGGFSGSGTYTFSAGIDLGSVKRVQLRTTITVATVQAATLLDSRTELVDDWLDWDGPAAGAVGDCVIEVRETDDDPAGTPTWSAWRRLITADYHARAFQFRALLSCSDPAYNVQVSALRVAAVEVV